MFCVFSAACLLLMTQKHPAYRFKKAYYQSFAKV